MAEVKEFHGTGDSAVRPDKPMTDRKVVVVVMKHPTEEKFLCVRNKKFGWIDFVMGGIEGEETPVQAGERSQEEADLADVLWVDVAELADKLHTDGHRWDLERVLMIGE